jgi:hypothetical protein
MRELLFKLKQAGFESVMLDGGIIVSLSSVTITFGADEELFMANIQENLEYGPVFTSLDDLTQAQAIELCQSYVKPVVPVRPELV